MKHDTLSTISATLAALQPIGPAQQKDHIFSAAIHNIQLLTATLMQLREYLIHEVKSAEEEIHYFKYIKPRIHSPLIHHYHIRSMLSGLPISGKKDQLEYLQLQANHYQSFLDSNQFTHHYLLYGDTYLDEKMFMRGRTMPLHLLPALEPDVKNSTGYDYLASAITATQQTLVYIHDTIQYIENPQAHPARVSSLIWTDSKRALIEMAYALHEAGAFNNGNAELKEVLEGLEICFNVKLGNASRTFSEILSRKSGDANYMELLVEKLKQRIAKIDDRHYRKNR